jgi:deoxyribodipyrimidine photolyase-related protein
LDRFGELEDAMYTNSDFVHHSLLSIPINFWLLTPQEVIAEVEKSDTEINNKEWFIRQVLGWREYMYHWFMFYKNDIYEANFFDFTKDLPKRFWRPETSNLKMNCVQNVIEKVDRLWYSHHIERLMIIGNFCLLVWYNPQQVNKRFREQYADAFEWVVTPNVLWMSQYADGWNLATKPYVASANYVNKMSNFCKTCIYDPKEKYGEKACPLNYLYRKFIDTNKEVFIKWRQSFILNHLKKIDMDQISQQSRDFIATLQNENID